MGLNEHLSAVEIHSGIHASKAKAFHIVGRNKEQRVNHQRNIHGKMQAVGGFIKGMSDKFIELLIFLLCDFVFVARPDCLNGVDLLRIDQNGKWNKVRIFLHNASDVLFIGKLLCIITQFKYDLCSPLQSLHRLDGILPAAVRTPLHASRFGLPGSGFHCNLFCNHKGE